MRPRSAFAQERCGLHAGAHRLLRAIRRRGLHVERGNRVSGRVRARSVALRGRGRGCGALRGCVTRRGEHHGAHHGCDTAGSGSARE